MSAPVTPTFTHSGHRYVLGYLPDAYGIWDRQHPGGPVEGYAKTHEGWAQAWARYVSLEPGHVTVGASGTASSHPPIGARYPIEPVGGLATALTLLLGLSGTIAAVSALSTQVEIRLLHRVSAGSVTHAELLASDQRQMALSNLAGVALLAAGVVWLIWQHRAQTNLWAMRVLGLRFTPGWAVGWWFVPFANLVEPFRATSELWRASDPDAPSAGWPARRAPALLGVWWIGYLVNSAMGGVAGFLRLQAVRDGDIAGITTSSWLRLAGEVATVGAAVLAIFVVRGVSARQSAKIARGPSASDVQAPPGSAYANAGARHAIGTFEGTYAVFDLASPAVPIERFPATPEGWRSAWARFAALEPNSPAVRGTAAPTTLGRMTAIFGIASAVTSILFLGIFFGPIALILGAVGRARVAHSPDPAREARRLRLGMILGGIGLAISVAETVLAALYG